MKKILVLLILSYGQLVALDRESTLKIYHHIFAALSSQKAHLVYLKDQEYIDVFQFSKKVLISKKLHGSDIALITDKMMLRNVIRNNKLNTSKTILFATDYHFLKKSEDIVGAFYWKKGRSQLMFIKSRLKKHHIQLPLEYQDFIVDEL